MRKSDNKRLDEIGKALVKASTQSHREIDTITANPELFDAIRARVSLGDAQSVPRQFFFRRPFVSSFASVVLLATAAFGLIIFRSKPVDLVPHAVTVTPTINETRTFSEPDNVPTSDFTRTTTSPRTERVALKSDVRTNRRKESAAQQIRYEEDFYALSYAGDPNETERGSRIVRVDVPRSTLFAMGVDVPLENELDTAKADLLIGSDGVTRAIRVVK